MAPKKVCILGSGNWGSTIACLVGENAVKYPEVFDPQVFIRPLFYISTYNNPLN